MKITKTNWPGWAIAVGVICSVIFGVSLESTPSGLVWLMTIVLYVAVGGLMIGTAALIIRALKGMFRWVASAEEKKQRRSRAIGITIGIIAASPLIFYWFISITLAIGFMSIALSQRMQYH